MKFIGVERSRKRREEHRGDFQNSVIAQDRLSFSIAAFTLACSLLFRTQCKTPAESIYSKLSEEKQQ
jgi:hypothetical protein